MSNCGCVQPKSNAFWLVEANLEIIEKFAYTCVYMLFFKIIYDGCMYRSPTRKTKKQGSLGGQRLLETQWDVVIHGVVNIRKDVCCMLCGCCCWAEL